MFEHQNIDILTGLDRGEIAVRLTRSGKAQPPFVAHTVPDIGRRYADRRALIVERSRRLYDRPREIIERKLERWSYNRQPEHISAI